MRITHLHTFLTDTKGRITWVFGKLTTDEEMVGYSDAVVPYDVDG